MGEVTRMINDRITSELFGVRAALVLACLLCAQAAAYSQASSALASDTIQVTQENRYGDTLRNSVQSQVAIIDFQISSSTSTSVSNSKLSVGQVYTTEKDSAQSETRFGEFINLQVGSLRSGGISETKQSSSFKGEK